MARNTETLRNTRDTFAESASTLGQDIREVRDAAKRVATDSMGAMRETAHQFVDDGRSRVRALGDDVQAKVQAQPIKSLLIAAGVGALIGALFLRR
jgi:ElaB/YqjD/DUF883 family membrane-anchored ribosome-binding protein